MQAVTMRTESRRQPACTMEAGLEAPLYLETSLLPSTTPESQDSVLRLQNTFRQSCSRPGADTPRPRPQHCLEVLTGAHRVQEVEARAPGT